MAKRALKQQSIPGTNIPELENVAEEYYAKVAERIELQQEEAKLKSALLAVTEDLLETGRLTPPKDGKVGVVYRYQGDEEPRVVRYRKKTTATVSVRNESSVEQDEDEDTDE